MPDILNAIHQEFSLGVYISKEDIKSRLKRIYTQFGIKQELSQIFNHGIYDWGEGAFYRVTGVYMRVPLSMD